MSQMTYTALRGMNLQDCEWDLNRGRRFSARQQSYFDKAHRAAMRAVAERGVPLHGAVGAVYRARIVKDVWDEMPNWLSLLWPVVAPFLKNLIAKIVELLTEKIDELSRLYQGDGLHSELTRLVEESKRA